MSRSPSWMASRTRAVALLVEIGMPGKETFGLRGRRIAEAVDIMVAIAFGMGDAEQRAQRQILLHGKARLAGEASPVMKYRAPSTLHFAARTALMTDL